MIRLLAVLAFLFAAAFVPAQAQSVVGGTCMGGDVYVAPDTLAQCSHNVFLQGPCNGTDITWSTSPGYPTFKMLPWENTDITIRHVKANFFHSGALMNAQVGFANGSPDISLTLDNVWPGGGAGRIDFQAGTGFGFHSAARNPGGYVDLHVSCEPAADMTGVMRNTFNAFVTFFYTVP